MKKVLLALSILVASGFIASGAFAKQPASMSFGESEFKEHCVVCHAEGGNIINPKKTLHKQDLKANHIKNAADIVKIIRRPGPGMTTFDKKTVSDKEARAIAHYILKTF
jgi:cytochrome c6